MEHIYVLHTDGSCLGNPGPGGVGVHLKFPENLGLKDELFYRGFHQTTNNRMELMAAIMGLKLLREKRKQFGNRESAWFTDSQYIAENIYQIPKWRKNQWEKENGEPILNKDLWKDLEAVRSSLRIYPAWVPRDSNTQADELAKNGSNNPTYKDLGFNPGRVGTSIGSDGRGPKYFEEETENLEIRIYKGDGQPGYSAFPCKVRFQIIENGKLSTTKYYTYVSVENYGNLHRHHHYLVSTKNGKITSILSEKAI